MRCPRFDDLDDAPLLEHLEGCPDCAALSRADAPVADALVAAAASAGRVRAARRRAASGLFATSLVLVAFLAVKVARRPEPAPVYVLHGDETGIVLTGPDLVRRAESLPPPRPPKGDRL